MSRAETIEAAIRRAVGRDFDFEILSRHAVDAARAGRASAIASGRAFIAGDAAHVMSPTGGFGMNTGIEDAVDLSWKLAAMLEGWGGGDLLDSYDARAPAGGDRATSREASGNLARMLSPARQPDLLDDTTGKPAHARAEARPRLQPRR